MKSDSDQNGAVRVAADSQSPLKPAFEANLQKPQLTAQELEAEAIAEEEFVADIEEKIENPLVADDYDLLFAENAKEDQEKDKKEESNEKNGLLAGSIVSGEVQAKKKVAFNNEQALREEKMDEENKNLAAATNADVNTSANDDLEPKKDMAAAMESLLAGDTGASATTPSFDASGVASMSVAPAEPVTSAESVAPAESTAVVDALASTGTVAVDATMPTETVTADPIIDPIEATPAVEAPVMATPVMETPAMATPAMETPAMATPVAETPITTTPAAETPIAATPAAEASVAGAPIIGGVATAEAPMSTNPVNPAAPVMSGVSNANPAMAAPLGTTAPVAPTISTAPAMAGNPAAAGAKKKANGKLIGIIAASVAAVLLLAGGGVFAFMHETPEARLDGALMKLMSADRSSVDVSVDYPNAKEEGVDDFNMSMKVVNEGGKGVVGANFSGSQKEVGTISLGANIGVDFDAHKLSLNVDGVKDTVDSITTHFVDYMFSADDRVDFNFEKPDFEHATKDLKADTLNWISTYVDSQWFELPTDELSKKDKKKLDAIFDAVNGLRTPEFKKKMANIYKDNKFVKPVEDQKSENKDGLTFYEIEVDDEVRAKFDKELEKLDEYKALEDALGSSSSELHKFSKGVTLDFLSGAMEERGVDSRFLTNLRSSVRTGSAPDVKVFVGIKAWSHEMQAFKIELKDAKHKSNNMSFNGKLAYGKKVQGTYPSETKSFKDVEKSATEDGEKLYDGLVVAYAKLLAADKCRLNSKDDDTVRKCMDDSYKRYENQSKREIERLMSPSLNPGISPMVDDLDLEVNFNSQILGASKANQLRDFTIYFEKPNTLISPANW